MMHENKENKIPYILSEAAQEAYNKIKALILRIFSLLKKEEKENDLKEKFYDSYMDFARVLSVIWWGIKHMKKAFFDTNILIAIVFYIDSLH